MRIAVRNHGDNEKFIKALKELIKAVITKPRKYKPAIWEWQLLKRKTGLRKHQKIAVEYFVDGVSQNKQTSVKRKRQ